MTAYPTITMADIKARCPEDYHWFSKATMKWFKTKLPPRGVQTPWGNFFVSRETNPSGTTAFSIRVQNPETGKISTVGSFHEHASSIDAGRALKHHFQQLEKYSGL